MSKKRLAIVLGIRPDVIRACLVLNKIREMAEFDIRFIWSGQHYSANLKDIFFRELGVRPPEVELNAVGANDAQVASSVIAKLEPILADLKPSAVVFLGDTNTVMGCIAAASLNLPIVHIEGCMRSYDWRMPEEKYRGTIDHLSDVIYTYFEEYRQQGIAEGLNPNNIVLTTNPIVDVLNHFYFEKKAFYDAMATDTFFRDRGLRRGEFYLATWHRRENVHIPSSVQRILSLFEAAKRPIYFPASYRTQRVLKESGLSLPSNVTMVDPIGYQEMLVCLTNSRGVITDSGTVVEETCVLQVPSLQMRMSTERPQVYDARSSVKFDPTDPERYPNEQVIEKFEALYGKTWAHGLGDGHASERITADLVRRLRDDDFARHRPSDYHLDIRRSYREDGL